MNTNQTEPTSLPPAELFLDVQRASKQPGLPSDEELTRWATAALGHRHDQAEMTVRIVDEDESQTLNSQYRGKDKPTNVLSFPSDLPAELIEELELPLLGDLVICAPVVAREAEQQHKALAAHWAHMTVHGTLHLLGYDHIEDDEAEIMENLETRILAQLGFNDPYAPVSAHNDASVQAVPADNFSDGTDE
ncbi:rRNA maturation RNase YbeY [Microbulbifer sp. CAU 1566]|uniref:rRNA maturation RNase YbeY n=1 Tax=Microbulbifer sp. CAU 1566 TaxID=2933269 RepID=UPI002003FE64|nr:rRNA maturation RNase YbeY [Microbulbifer sp. CAU 1566]MCK7598241.1 rRNA maturation RNase YbeY [Microbulbifer sp. CAU 1566]